MEQNLPIVEVFEGDITTLKVDAIVNAANASLLGGRGVDGAIHRIAGPGLLEECQKLGGCETGDAKRTFGHHLMATYVIHTVGPIYWEHEPHEAARLLISCYRRCLEVATETGNIRSIAFPCISTGAYGYPPHEAACIAYDEVTSWLRGPSNTRIKRVIFCTVSPEMTATYKVLLAK